jgi:hypothetical protein
MIRSSKEKSNRSIFTAGMIASIVTLGVLLPGLILWTSHPMISTSYYHYNLQYRAGNEDVYAQIVENSLQHVVYMYGNHSSWNYTIETQFMMIEYVHDNYLGLYDEIKRQNLAGQLELIVVQFSDSFQVPYTLKNFKESINYTTVRMEEYGLRQSKLILLQEGQWLPGWGQAAPDHDAAIISVEQCGYFGYYPSQPVVEWELGGVTKHAFVIPWFPTFEAGVYHHQIYTQDGEKINTGGYGSFDTAQDFDFNPLKQSNLELRHIELEKQGNLFMTLEDFYDMCVEKNYVDKMEKFIPETEWVAAQYRTFWNWMGQGNGWTDDGQMLARVYNAMTITQSTELLLNKSYALGFVNATEYAEWGQYRIGGVDGKLLQAKKAIWEAQVTDTTGISPRYIEFWYGMNKTYDAVTLCDEIITDIRSKPGNPFAGTIQINPYKHEVQNETINFINSTDLGVRTIEDIETVFNLHIIASQTSEYETLYPVQINANFMNLSTTDWFQEYYRLNFDFRGYYNVEFNHSDASYISESSLNTLRTAGVSDKNMIAIMIEDNWNTISYSPALMENYTVQLNRDDYYSYLYDSDTEWIILLAACNGMVYNPIGGYGIVKNTTIRHLAANWRSDSIEFKEDQVKYSSSHEYFFVPGSLSDVLRFANQINSYRWVTL